MRHRNTQTAPFFSTPQPRCLSQTTQPSLFHGPPQGGGSRLARSGGGFGRARHCCSALPFWTPPSASAHFPQVRRPATVGQGQKQGSVRLCRGKNCRLTLRSSGAPTAGHQARSGGTRYIFASPGLASYRRRPLNSNVRPHQNRTQCEPHFQPRPRWALAPRPQSVAPGLLPDIGAVPCSVVRLSPYATVLSIRTAALPVIKTVSLLARCRACNRGFSKLYTRQRGFSRLASSRASTGRFKFIVKLCRSLSTPRRPTAARCGLTPRSS